MATVKVKFLQSDEGGNCGIIIYQISHERKKRQISTNYQILCSEWNEKHGQVVECGERARHPYIFRIRQRIRQDVERISGIFRKFESKGIAYTADDVVNEYIRYLREFCLFSYMEGIIRNLKANGKERTAETYTAARNSFKKFMTCEASKRLIGNDDDIEIDRISTELMEAFEAWHHQRGVTYNTISFYMRIIRAVYNRAVEDGVTENHFPFRHVYTGVDKTVKRALPLSVIRKIKNLDLSNNPSLDFARDMFILSFMLRGMSFIDMAYLTKTDLANGYVVYRRRKTGQQLTIAWTKEMQMILDKYPENKSHYLLPIIKNCGTNDRWTYRNVSYNINRNLKIIACRTGITIPLTLYVARHSWASAAKAKGIPLSIISEGMGHDSEATTRIYLASLETTLVDQANSLIISSL
ncbi:MAG: site-specific integrase [Muribaculaceae bacterium]|nr:site-specific integrase [Muribaculaceae bacterium]